MEHIPQCRPRDSKRWLTHLPQQVAEPQQAAGQQADDQAVRDGVGQGHGDNGQERGDGNARLIPFNEPDTLL